MTDIVRHPGATVSRRSLLGVVASLGLGHLVGISAAQGHAQPAENGAEKTVSWFVTTPETRWQAGRGAALANITGIPDVFLSGARQTIAGFGACFNELGWDALSRLERDKRDAVLKALFGADGARFSLCRMPVGANDFSRDWYSYDETPGDFELKRFSVANDEKTLIPFIKAAKVHQPGLKLWASPWSPPTWMKRNGHYASVPNRSGSPANGIRPDQIGREGTDMFLVEPKYLDAYARYFGKFIDSYRSRGIAIGMVMPQNEFNSAQPFPSCTWTPGGLTAFLPYLGKEMGARGVDIFLGTLERPDSGLFEKVFADPTAGPFIKGVGVQWAGKDAVPWIHRAHPELPIYQSEQECGDGKNDWRYCRYTWSLVKHYLRNGATAYQYWNMALVDGGVSRWGWAQNSLISVDKATGEHRMNHEYWLMKHLSHFVEPGAVRIEAVSYTGYEDVLGFKNPDGSHVVVAHNPLTEVMPIGIAVAGRLLQATLPANSFNTFKIA
ncbi:MAG TPA: glycoside hydrolase family 30 beta sandwich domain-containing protein [Sphingobium sp.]|uniref:glycoside hydrolase family 30 protein n=1 Tax=Sphingobium sp. TaxID=1912891 RepID=UPI002ED3FA5A